MKLGEFVDYFEALFFSKAARRLDIQVVTSGLGKKREATWDSNKKSKMFSEILNRKEISAKQMDQLT